jgi:hypothetical protein
MAMAEKKSNALRRKFIIAASGVLLLAFYLFQVSTGGFRSSFFSSTPLESATEGSLQASVDSCKRLIRSQLGSALQQMDVDDMATRYEVSTKAYRVFINVIVDGAEREDTYVECRTSAVTHKVLDFNFNGPSRHFEQIGI